MGRTNLQIMQMTSIHHLTLISVLKEIKQELNKVKDA